MINIGVVVIMGAVLISMGVAIFAYYEYQPVIVSGDAGEPVRVGPMIYTITYEGMHGGSEETVPEYEFFRIGIVAENTGEESTDLSGGQFFLVKDGSRDARPVFGNFGDADLLYHTLEPGEDKKYSTQFDVEFDEDAKYEIRVQPRKEQSSTDIGIVCLLNC